MHFSLKCTSKFLNYFNLSEIALFGIILSIHFIFIQPAWPVFILSTHFSCSVVLGLLCTSSVQLCLFHLLDWWFSRFSVLNCNSNSMSTFDTLHYMLALNLAASLVCLCNLLSFFKLYWRFKKILHDYTCWLIIFVVWMLFLVNLELVLQLVGIFYLFTLTTIHGHLFCLTSSS